LTGLVAPSHNKLTVVPSAQAEALRILWSGTAAAKPPNQHIYSYTFSHFGSTTQPPNAIKIEALKDSPSKNLRRRDDLTLRYKTRTPVCFSELSG